MMMERGDRDSVGRLIGLDKLVLNRPTTRFHSIRRHFSNQMSMVFWNGLDEPTDQNSLFEGVENQEL
jgi:hypothetical protein